MYTAPSGPHAVRVLSFRVSPPLRCHGYWSTPLLADIAVKRGVDPFGPGVNLGDPIAAERRGDISSSVLGVRQ
jgi:hypothetical protein